MKKLFILIPSLIFLTGCFDTTFNFKTNVSSDGSIVRETKIEGRGADRFLPPSGKGWEVKTYQTRGGQSVLDDKYYHIYAIGRFKNSAQIGSDYRFDSDKAFSEVSDEERQNFIQLGIVEPFNESIYSKNDIQVVKHGGLFKSRFEYTESFKNQHLIELLLNDLKKEVVRQQDVVVEETPEAPSVKAPAAPDGQSAEDNQQAQAADAAVLPVTIEGQLLSAQKTETLAQAKLDKEILSQFKFHSEVTLPGKIISSNADRILGNTAIWDFTAKDFKGGIAQKTLAIESEMIEWKTIVLLAALGILIIFGIGSAFTKKPKTGRSRSGKRS